MTIQEHNRGSCRQGEREGHRLPNHGHKLVSNISHSQVRTSVENVAGVQIPQFSQHIEDPDGIVLR